MFDALRKKIGSDIAVKILDLHSKLNEVTPKDTTYASNSYYISIGIPVFYPSVDKPTVQDASSAKIASLATKNILKNYKLNGDIFITSTVPYLDLLNAGKSKQAPAGFLQQTINRVLR